jgi:hypothetical protein
MMAMKQAMQPIVVQDMLHMHDRTASSLLSTELLFSFLLLFSDYLSSRLSFSISHPNLGVQSIGLSIGSSIGLHWPLSAKISALRHD